MACRFLSLDEEARRVGKEGPLAVYLVMDIHQLLAILLNTEARNDPRNETKEVHNRADVSEADQRALRTQVDNIQPGCLGISARKVRAPCRCTWPRSQQCLGQLTHRLRTNLLRQEGTSRAEYPRYFAPLRVGWVARDNQVEPAVGQREWFFVGGGDYMNPEPT